MAYFPSLTSDDLTVTGTLTSINTTLVMGWCNPTALTAGRAYWSSSANNAIRVAPTTSEIRVVNDRTTDQTWDSSGAGIVIAVWTFIAVLSSETGGAQVNRIWVGTVDKPPTECTGAVVTAGSGAAAGDAASITIGNNAAAGTTGLAAVFGQWVDMRCSGDSIVNMFGIAATGTITQNEADQVKASIIVPFWEGRSPNNIGFVDTNGSEIFLMNNEIVPSHCVRMLRSNLTIADSQKVTTISASMLPDQQRQPVNPIERWPAMLDKPRRR